MCRESIHQIVLNAVKNDRRLSREIAILVGVECGV